MVVFELENIIESYLTPSDTVQLSAVSKYFHQRCQESLQTQYPRYARNQLMYAQMKQQTSYDYFWTFLSFGIAPMLLYTAASPKYPLMTRVANFSLLLMIWGSSKRASRELEKTKEVLQIKDTPCVPSLLAVLTRH